MEIRNSKMLINVEKNCSLSTTYNAEMTHRKQQKVMNGDITLEALRQCRRQWRRLHRL